MKVALIGSRGIPANYGGYETLMEELAHGLVAAGIDVTVYCRSHHTPRRLREYKGARLVVLPTIRTKHLDTPVHTLLSAVDATVRRFDAALVVNSANAIFVPLLRLARIPTALHVDGIEKRRAKWGWFGRSVYGVSEWLACHVANRLVTDAEVIRRHYLDRHGAESVPITYGVDPVRTQETDTLERLGLEQGRYFLYVSRFEPENNPHRVVEAFASVTTDLPLVMVGGAPYSHRFVAQLRAAADGRVLFPGPIYGDGYRQLLSHAFAYIHATEVGGTHPALVEAMGYGNCLVVNDTPENREVAGDAALYFRASEPRTLTARLEELLADPERRQALGPAAAERAARLYSWPRVCSQYVELFRQLASRRLSEHSDAS